MQKITAYRANNGRVFLSEQACLDYEKAMAEYPKIYLDKTEVHPGIFKFVRTTKETPRAQTKKETWYEVKGNYKYKFRALFRTDMFDYPDRVEWYFAKEILEKGSKMSAALCHHIFGELVYDPKHRGERWGLEDGTIENERWKFSDVRWYGGAVRPDVIEITPL